MAARKDLARAGRELFNQANQSTTATATATAKTPPSTAAVNRAHHLKINGSSDLGAFTAVFTPLAEKSESGKAARRRAFREVDPNGNGFVSLAELDDWIRAKLRTSITSRTQADRLWRLYRPAFILAHADAADIMADDYVAGTRGATADDFVQRSEFRFACAYLVLYAGMLDAFMLIDGGSVGRTAEDDRRISLQEFSAGYMQVLGYGFKGLEGIGSTRSPEAVFRLMDTNNGGFVLYSEWCEFLKQAEIANRTVFGRLLEVDT